ncbi:MAG: PKD domain-containing protein [Acidobacteria bacterium]|nr:PKD domain-containing protein [Acidobacteriota bacterium]MBI3645557.1 PKD domain-containing protein [Terriglobales bacterium]
MTNLVVSNNQKAFANYLGFRGDSNWAGFNLLGTHVRHYAVSDGSITYTPAFSVAKGSHPNVTQQVSGPQATATPTSGPAPLTVAFVGVTYPYQGIDIRPPRYFYSWNFGDGQSSGSPTVTHTYQTPGNYVATYTISGGLCEPGYPCFSASIAITVTANQPDSDADGLPDAFENQVANLLTPQYHVSSGEQSGTGFAIFGDYVPETPTQVFGPVPPRSYFRVTPLGFATSQSGVQYGFIRLDYLTLWNRDDGLNIGGSCVFDLTFSLGLAGFSASQILDGIASHPLDNERSAVLIAAPTLAPNTYSTNTNDYSAYSFYTAAHEGTVLDASEYFDPSPAVPVSGGAHLIVGLSRSKHGTYMFNPNGYPLVPIDIRVATFAIIQFLYDTGQIDYLDYEIYNFIAYSAFYQCVIEHFGDQGGAYASARTNVGEISHPGVGSGFILDPQLSPKLTVPLWTLQ